MLTYPGWAGQPSHSSPYSEVILIILFQLESQMVSRILRRTGGHALLSVKRDRECRAVYSSIGRTGNEHSESSEKTKFKQANTGHRKESSRSTYNRLLCDLFISMRHQSDLFLANLFYLNIKKIYTVGASVRGF